MTQHWLSKHLGTREAAAGLALILGRPLVQSGHLKRILFLSPTLEDGPIKQSPATSRFFYGSILSQRPQREDHPCPARGETQAHGIEWLLQVTQPGLNPGSTWLTSPALPATPRTASTSQSPHPRNPESGRRTLATQLAGAQRANGSR